MTRLDLPYVHRFRDRSGTVRHYFRRAGHKTVALPGAVGSPEFMAAYAAAAGRKHAAPVRYGAGTVGALIVAWYRSAEFIQLADSTKTVYRNIAERFAQGREGHPVKLLETRHIRRIVAAKAETPGAANNLLKVVRLMLEFAVADGWIDTNPAVGVKKVRGKSDGRHSWTEAEIAAFEAHWPIGSRARLALALLLYTAQRRGDVIRMGKQHVQGGAIWVAQQKTGARLEIPIHPKLREVIDATPSNHLTFLTTAAGAPFTSAGFGNLFRDYCDKAGLPPECASHGLRKAASRRLADAGCSAHQIQAITGHASIAEVQRYTKAANQITLATAAMNKLQKPE